MYCVCFEEKGNLIKCFDREGISLTHDQRTALCFDTEFAAWSFLLLVADFFNYDFDVFYVQFFKLEEVN